MVVKKKNLLIFKLALTQRFNQGKSLVELVGLGLFNQDLSQRFDLVKSSVESMGLCCNRDSS